MIQAFEGSTDKKKGKLLFMGDFFSSPNGLLTNSLFGVSCKSSSLYNSVFPDSVVVSSHSKVI